ncbi:MAG: MOSC domain-containing protein [Sphaerochaetaceae bacterium]|nr:MOSC domain-containing protein [Sphaerochaetaceae bacterium]
MARVIAVCISEKRGTVKKPVDEITLKIDHGIIGDAHAGSWHRQISLLGNESVDRMRKMGLELNAGVFAENILTEGITLNTLPIGTRLRIGKSLVEVTQIGKECHNGCEIRKKTGFCVMPTDGIFAKVIEEGTIKSGDEITIEK